MEPFWERVSWALLIATIGGVAWVAKSLLKPWSDASLERSKAFVSFAETLARSVPSIQGKLETLELASKESNSALNANTDAAKEQTEMLRAVFGSDPTKICKAMQCKADDLVIDSTLFKQAVEHLAELRKQGDLKNQPASVGGKP